MATTPDYLQFAVRRDIVERLRLVGSTNDRQCVLTELYDSGFTVTFSGAYTQESTFPLCDDTKFLIIAERLEMTRPASPRDGEDTNQ
jgi:hypothetical protein